MPEIKLDVHLFSTLDSEYIFIENIRYNIKYINHNSFSQPVNILPSGGFDNELFDMLAPFERAFPLVPFHNLLDEL